MLTSITLQHFALATQLELELSAGFNVLTGETGAGKSLLLDALSVCLGAKTDSNFVRYGQDKAEVIATFSYQADSAEALWLAQRELLDESQEIIIRRVIFANGRSKVWINGRPVSLTELKQLGQYLALLYSQHSQQQLLDPPYPRRWLDRYAGLSEQANQLKLAYHTWQEAEKHYQQALRSQHDYELKQEQLRYQIEEIEPLSALPYVEIEQEYDRLSNHEQMMQDCAAILYALDEADHSIAQELGQVLKKAENQSERAPQLNDVLQNILTAQNELHDAVATLRQFADHQSFDPDRMQQLDEQLGQFHRLARKYRSQPEQLSTLYQTWQDELEQLHSMANVEQLAETANTTQQHYLALAQQLDTIRQQHAKTAAKTLTEQVRPLSLEDACFLFEFEPLAQANQDGLSDIRLLFSANKGIPPQPLAKVASGGELSRIALVMQVMNTQQADAEVLVFDEIDVGISGGTAEIVGRLLADLAQHVQIICVTHQAQVAAQSDQHLLVAKLQTDPASSHIIQLNEDQRIEELARMTGGVDINTATIEHAKQLRNLKFIHSKN